MTLVADLGGSIAMVARREPISRALQRAEQRIRLGEDGRRVELAAQRFVGEDAALEIAGNLVAMLRGGEPPLEAARAAVLHRIAHPETYAGWSRFDAARAEEMAAALASASGAEP